MGGAAAKQLRAVIEDPSHKGAISKVFKGYSKRMPALIFVVPLFNTDASWEDRGC